MSKNLRKSLLFIVATAFVVSLILSFSFFTKITYAEDSGNKDYYLTDVHQIKTLREHTNGQIFYYDTDGSGKFAIESDVHVYRSTSAPRLVPQNSQDAAFVWTAPESGVVYSALSSQDIVINDNKSTGFMVAQAKVYNGAIDPSFLNGGELVFYSNASGNNLNISDVIKTNTATSKGSSATVGRIEMGFGTSTNPISVRKGEQLMVIVRAVNTVSSDTSTTDAAVLGRWNVNFKADGQSAYTSTNLCANLTGVTDETFLSTVNGLNFDFVSVGQSLVSFNQTTEASTLTVADYSDTLYSEMNLIVAGQFNETGSGNWAVAATGSNYVRIITNGNYKRAIAFRAPSDGIAQIQSLTMAYYGGSRAVDYDVLYKSGLTGEYRYLYQPVKDYEYDGGMFSLGTGESHVVTSSEIPTLDLEQGDEIIISVYSVYFNETIAVDLQLDFFDGNTVSNHVLSKTTKLSAQGDNNFYCLSLAYKTNYTQIETFDVENLASLRLSEESGIRFLMSMDWAEYYKMYNLYYKTGLEFGMIILPKAYIDDGNANFKGAVNEENLFGENAIYNWRLQGEDYVPEDGKTRITLFTSDKLYKYANLDDNKAYMLGSIVDLKEQNYTLDLACIGFIKIVDGTETHYIFSDTTAVKNAREVALSIYNSEKYASYDETYQAIIKKYAGIVD